MNRNQYRHTARRRACSKPWLALVFLGLCLSGQGAEVLIWGAAQAVMDIPAAATNLATVTGGDFHAVALKRDGSILSWGADTWERIGGVTSVPKGLTNVVAVAAGAAHTLALRADGSLAMWGAIVGDGYGLATTNIAPEATNIVALAPGTGAWHALVLRADGTVVDWGSSRSGLDKVPVTARHIVSVAAGSWHAVALRADGRVVSWGDNSYGQTNVPASATNIVAIAADESGTVALRADGTLLRWSGNVSSSVFGLNDVIDIACPFRPYGSPYPPYLALKRDGKLAQGNGGAAPPTQATNIAAVAGTSDNGIALVGTGSPVFPGLPVNRTVVSGARAYFRAVATGAWPIRYQWTYNATNLPGATNTVLVLTNVQPDNAGWYSLVASNTLGMVTNSAMLLTVLPLELTQEPVDKLQYMGGTVTFTAAAEGQGPLGYQWLFNGTPLSGATNASLALTNLQADAAGAYAVIVSNVHGAVTSRAAQLTLQPILLTNWPPTQTILLNSNKVLSVGALGAGALSYQWQLNGTDLVAATNATLTLPGAGLTDAGVYTVGISNAYGSTNISFTLNIVPSIVLSRPSNQPIFRNGTASFSLGVQTLIPTSYQWCCNGSILPGATAATLALTNVQPAQAGTYSVILSNQFEMSTNDAWLAVVEVAAWGFFRYQTNVPPTTTNLLAIAQGTSHDLALTAAGDIIGWGNNFAGQMTPPPALTNCIAIAAGNPVSVGLQRDGRVLAWGQSAYTNVPLDLTNAVAIAAGHVHCLGLTTGGAVRAWGDNACGQTSVPASLSNVVAISAGQNHSLALKADGGVVAWGAGTNNTGIHPNWGQSVVPAQLSNVVQIAAGGTYSLALKSDGTVVAWGNDSYGLTHVPIDLSNVVAIAAGFSHALALKADGTLTAWGNTDSGQTDIPSGLTNVVAIASNPNGDACLALVGNGPPVQHAMLVEPSATAQGVSVTVPTQSGRVYRLEYASALTASEWTPLPLVAGTGTNLTLLDTTAGASPQRYYRVRRW